MYALIFFGEDGKFHYTYSVDFDSPEVAFRTPRLFGLTWTFDGDTWSSSRALFNGPDKWGTWAISNTMDLNPMYFPGGIKP